MSHISETELLEDLQRVTEEVDAPPLVEEYRERGAYAISTFYDRFDTWGEAKAAAGLGERERPPDVTKEELLEDMQRVSDVVGRAPSIEDYREHGEHSVTTFYERFDSWRGAQAAAGFEPREPRAAVDDADLLAAVDRLADDLGRRPTAAEMNEHGEYWASTYRNHFGSWHGALRAAGFDVSDGPGIGREELLAEVGRLHDLLGEVPNSTDMADVGKYGVRTYEREFGSWPAAVETYEETKEPELAAE